MLHAHPCAVCGEPWTGVDTTPVCGEDATVIVLCPRCRKDRWLHVPLLLELAAGGDPHGLRAEAWRRWANDVRRQYRLRVLIAVVYVAVAALAAGIFFEQWWAR